MDRLESASTVAVMSCRLSDAESQNCYHLKRGGPFRRDATDPLNVLIFSVSNLSSNNVDCINVTGNFNVTMNRQLSILNGFELNESNQLTTTFNLEGDDLLVRVPPSDKTFLSS